MISQELVNNVAKKMNQVAPNLCSPLGMTYILILLYLSSAGETRVFLQEYLNITQSDKDIFKSLKKSLKLCDDSDICNIKNAIFSDKGYKLVDKLVDKFKDVDIDVKEFDNSNSKKSVKKINKWAKKATNDLISEIVSEEDIDAETVAFFINSIYFNHEWKNKFDSKLMKGNFNNKKTKLMHLEKAKFNYCRTKKYQVIELDYKTDFKMTIILPRSNGDGYYPLVADQGQFDKLFHKEKILVLEVPPFKKRIRVSYKNYAKEMGFESLFESCNMDNLFKSGILDLFVHDIIQDVVIEVDTKGTRAASVTTAKMSKGKSRDIEFIADHSFSYSIKHKKSDVIIFSGLVTDLDEEIESSKFLSLETSTTEEVDDGSETDSD